MYSIPYRDEPYAPYWGPSSATENTSPGLLEIFTDQAHVLSWCEEDYIISPYIAEYINSLSNVLYIIISIYGFYRFNFDLHRSFPHIGLISVGVLSSLYHGSLKLPLQLGDSLSMVVATAAVLYRLLAFDRSSVEAREVMLKVFGAVVAFSVFHCLVNILLIHTMVFAGMLVFGSARMRRMLRKVRDREERRRIARTGWLADAFALVGFAFWGVDNLACEHLRVWRRKIGVPWGFLLEFHGWWHILTAVAAHGFIMMVDNTLVALERQKKVA